MTTICTWRHICNRCAHSRHNKCLGVVRCPDDGLERVCECCGKERDG